SVVPPGLLLCSGCEPVLATVSMLKIALIMFHAIARTEMQPLFALFVKMFVKIRNIFRHICAATRIAEKFLRCRLRRNARRFMPAVRVSARRPINGFLHHPRDSHGDDEPHEVAKNPSQKLHDSCRNLSTAVAFAG